MKVKDLIIQLQRFDPDADVDVCAQYSDDDDFLTTMYGIIGGVDDRRDEDENDTSACIHVFGQELVR